MSNETTQTVLVQEEEVKAPSTEVVHVENVSSHDGAASTRSIYRSPSDKVVAGVCGGLADFTGFDPTLIRLFWAVMTLVTGGGGFLAYLALWLLLPVGTVAEGEVRSAAIPLNEKNMIRAAYVLIGVGGLWLLANIGILGNIWGVFWSLTNVFFWPALLIGAGYLLLRGRNRSLKNDFDSVRSKVNVNLDGKMPSSDEVKAGMSSARARIPLKRSTTDRMLLGVCGGIGQRLGIDANLVRLIWAAFSIGSIGMGVLLYVLVGLLLPEESAIEVQNRMDAGDPTVVDGSATSA